MQYHKHLMAVYCKKKNLNGDRTIFYQHFRTPIQQLFHIILYSYYYSFRQIPRNVVMTVQFIFLGPFVGCKRARGDPAVINGKSHEHLSCCRHDWRWDFESRRIQKKHTRSSKPLVILDLDPIIIIKYGYKYIIFMRLTVTLSHLSSVRYIGIYHVS